MGDSARVATQKPARLRLLPWLKVLRPQFVIVAVIPVSAGLLLSRMAGPVDLWTAFLTLFGSTLFLLATNLVDEAWDFVQHQGSESFEGGSGVIQSGELPAGAVLLAGQIAFAICALGGLYVASLTDWLMALLTLVGLFSGYYYAAPPVRFGYRGLGEVFCALAMGPVLTAGTVYIQLGTVPLLAWSASLPIAATVAFILFAKSIPDIEQDRVNAKHTLAVRLGHTGSLRLYLVWLLAVVVVNAALSRMELLPAAMWASLAFLVPWLLLAPRAWRGEQASSFLHRLGGLALILYAVNGILLIAGLYRWLNHPPFAS